MDDGPEAGVDKVNECVVVVLVGDILTHSPVQKTSGMVQMDEGPLMGQSGVLERVAYFVPHGWCLNSTISGNKIKAL